MPAQGCEGSKYGSSGVDLNRILISIKEDGTQFGRFSTQKDVHHRLNEEELEDTEANAVDSGAYREAHDPEFENGSIWVVVAVASHWMSCATVSQPVDDGPISKGQIFTSKEEFVSAVKRFL